MIRTYMAYSNPDSFLCTFLANLSELYMPIQLPRSDRDVTKRKKHCQPRPGAWWWVSCGSMWIFLQHAGTIRLHPHHLPVSHWYDSESSFDGDDAFGGSKRAFVSPRPAICPCPPVCQSALPHRFWSRHRWSLSTMALWLRPERWLRHHGFEQPYSLHHMQVLSAAYFVYSVHFTAKLIGRCQFGGSCS